MMLLGSVLIILMDDVGTDKLASVCTPSIDAISEAGLTFERAYTNPLCVPTRASLMTGRWAFRTGLGAGTGPLGLEDSEITLAEALCIPNTMVGKWHLSGPMSPPTNPNDQGWDNFRGTLAGSPASYVAWDRTVNGVTNLETTYATMKNVVDLFETLPPTPFLAFVSFNACHGPHEAPPLCPPSPCICGQDMTEEEHYDAMLEEMDDVIGVIYETLLAYTGGELTTFIAGDNGTTRQFAAPCPKGGKSQVFEGGINVPLIVQGPGVVPGTTDALVHLVDLFATSCELVGAPVPASAEDSVSFLPVLAGGPSARSWVYCETFGPAGLPLNLTKHNRCVIEDRYKLIRTLGGPDLMYDLQVDPCETTNLLPNLSPAEQTAFDRLDDRMAMLGV